MTTETGITLKDQTLLSTQNYINGKWQNAISGMTYPVINPATGERIASAPDSDAIDAAHAARSAQKAFISVLNHL